MCKGDAVAESHRCVTACPVCHIFTPENALQLLSGEEVKLGQVNLVFEVAQAGCRLCQRLCEVWSLNQELFQPGNEVSVKLQEDAPPGLLMAVLFKIAEPLSFDWMREGTGRYRDKKFKSWAVPFGIYTKGSELLDHIIITRPPDPSVTGPEVFDAFKVNLEACLSDHTECRKPDINQLPTRILRVDSDDTNRVFVHECRPSEQGQYAALSYCWGKTTQVMLSMKNLEEFSKKGISVGTLPKTIGDSIIATRKLGIKYLWIDSLCIVQDSDEDKNKEIANMANIYKNATITISAAAATDCGEGFLEDRSEVQIRLDNSLCLPFLASADEENLAVADWIYLCSDPYMGYKVKLFAEEPINARAWTYQELTLSPRLLIFGSGPPQWHCKERWRISGLDFHPNHLPNPECTSGVMKITVEDGRIVADQTLRFVDRPAPPKDDIGLRLTWIPTLQNYSQRALSYRIDKLPALSALAAENQSTENGTYAAGLWEASLPRSLLWRCSIPKGSAENHAHQQANPFSNLHTHLSGAHPLNWLRTRLFDTAESSTWSSKYIVPTWSPLSTRDPIRFESTATQDEDEYHTTLVKINHIHVEHNSDINPFGRINFGYLDITGPMCSISWQELTANFVIMINGEPFAYWDFIIPDNPDFFEAMSAKYPPSFNPQELADTSVQEPIDENGNFEMLIGEGGIRVRTPVTREPASLECADADTPFTAVADVKQAVINALRPETPGTGSSNELCDTVHGLASRLRHQGSKSPVASEIDECEFWLLEVERSMSPAGLVLKQVEGDIFARVGYFGMNRSLDPEIVCLPGRIQVRGRKTWNFGGPESKNPWNDTLKRRRIYLV